MRKYGIVEASQAESAGLQEGDIILEYGGVPISSAQHLVSEVEIKSQLKSRVLNLMPFSEWFHTNLDWAVQIRKRSGHMTFHFAFYFQSEKMY